MKTPKKVALEVLELEKQIEDVEELLKALEIQVVETTPFEGCRLRIVKRTQYRFVGKWKGGRDLEIEIPDKLNAEIAAKCQVWLEELKKRQQNLIGEPKK